MNFASIAPLIGAVAAVIVVVLHARPQRESIITESTGRAMEIVDAAMQEQDKQIITLKELLQDAHVQSKLDRQELTLARAELKAAARRHRLRDADCEQRVKDLTDMVAGLGGDVDALKREAGHDGP